MLQLKAQADDGEVREQRYLADSRNAGLYRTHGWRALNNAQKPKFSPMGSPKWTVSPCISLNSTWACAPDKSLHAGNGQLNSFPFLSLSLMAKANIGDLTPNPLISGQSLYSSRSPASMLALLSFSLLCHSPPCVFKCIHGTLLGILQWMENVGCLD